METKKVIVWVLVVILIPILIGIFFALNSSEIDKLNNKKGLEIYPQQVVYECNLPGLSKTITVTNYDEVTKENIVFSVGWPNKNNLYVEARDVDNSQTDKIYESMEFEAENYSYKSYLLTSIKPEESARFDVLLRSNCQKDFPINFVLNVPFEIQERF